ncbi:hypothetical protein [Candidatus Magnetominusculus dajiuhuensis]|uniref:hypothetical protein n=1 Tax=Candidatus Magnetominusculus dajiuhuensis TaxID=3137712 RepID=UPI003B439528
MKRIVLSILIWVLASCSSQKAKEAAGVAGRDSYAGLWGMLALSTPPEVKPLVEGGKAVFKDASHSTGKGKIAVGTA